MWCVAELNEEYVRKLEDVLELYERPYLAQLLHHLVDKPADKQRFSASNSSFHSALR